MFLQVETVARQTQRLFWSSRAGVADPFAVYIIIYIYVVSRVFDLPSSISNSPCPLVYVGVARIASFSRPRYRRWTRALCFMHSVRPVHAPRPVS